MNAIRWMLSKMNEIDANQQIALAKSQSVWSLANDLDSVYEFLMNLDHFNRFSNWDSQTGTPSPLQSAK